MGPAGFSTAVHDADSRATAAVASMSAMIDCPVGAILAAAAGRLGEPLLAELATGLSEPVRVGVRGRRGAGRGTVRRALRGAGLVLADGPGSGLDSVGIDVYVAVETFTPEDRVALAGATHPCLAVLAKADLAGFAGFGGIGPLAVSADRCAALSRDTGVPVLPLAGLAAAAAFDPDALDDEVLGAIRSLAGGDAPARLRGRLLEELDLFGLAVAVAAVRAGADRAGVAGALRRASGVEAVLAEIGRAAAVARYRRASAALRTLVGAAAGRPGIARLLAGDALAEARMSLAAPVLAAAGLPGDVGGPDPLGEAISWRRYARGPLNAENGSCADDVVRGLLRRWSRERAGHRDSEMVTATC